jgi:DNA modification methylase
VKSKQTENIKATSLIADDKNFNKGSEAGAEMIRKSFEKFGSGRSILIDKNNRIIAGNKSVEYSGLQDVMIVESDGTQLIAVKRTDIDLDSPQGREMALADNASAKANIVFDAELVEAELGEAVCEEWGIDVATKLEAEEDDFEVPADGIETDIVLGDLFEIGEHRLLCGDSTDSDAVAKLMDGNKADMVFTDPPYRQEGHIEAAESEAKQQKGKERNSTREISPSLVNHAKKLKGLLDFEPKNFVNTLMSFNPLCVYIFCNKALVKEYLNYFEGYNYTILVWKKPTVSPFYVADYLADIEYILYFNKAGKVWNNKNQFKNYSRVLEAKQERGDHPTIKPISIIEPAILNSSNIKSLVLDLFLGSGSTMVASHQLKRKCYGMELDPKYCQVIIDRMRKLDPSLTIKRNGLNIT